MARKRGSGRRANGSSSSPNGPPPPPPLTRLPSSLTKAAPPVPGLFDPPSLDAEGKPSMAIDDFRGFGWSEDQINAAIDYPELRVDSMAQDPHDAHNTHEERLKHRIALNKHIMKTGLRGGKTTGPTKRTKHRRDCIFIEGSERWVLFDPLKGYAQDTESEPPPTQYAKYEIFKPGNRKIIAFNLVSSAVTLKTTPVEFIGYDIDYLPNGPKMIKEGEKKAARTQPVRKTRGKGKGKESKSSTESPKGKENEVAKQKETPKKKAILKVKEAPKQKPAPKQKEAAEKKEASKTKEALEKDVSKAEQVRDAGEKPVAEEAVKAKESPKVEESPKAEQVPQESEVPEQKEKTSPPTVRRSPRNRKRTREAEEVVAEVEVEASPKRRKVAVPKKKA